MERLPRRPQWASADPYTSERAVALSNAHFQFQQAKACARKGERLVKVMSSW
jgi:hypothetical protein